MYLIIEQYLKFIWDVFNLSEKQLNQGLQKQKFS